MIPASAVFNGLLARLPPAEYEQLQPHLEHVHLVKGQILYEAGSRMPGAHFLLSGMVCLLARTEHDTLRSLSQYACCEGAG